MTLDPDIAARVKIVEEDTTGADATGTDPTGITQPAGGKGIRGWLAGIFAAIRGLADSQLAAGSTAAAPAAGTSICATAALTAGTYLVTVTAYQSGTPDANGANASLRHGTTVVGALPTTAQPQTRTATVTVAATETLNVVTGGSAGGAGAVYNASLDAKRIA